MNKNIGIIIGLVAVVVIAGFAYSSMDTPAQTGDMSVKEVVEVNTEKSAKAGSYEAYAPEKLARAASGDVVLFFHASWCPSCRVLNADIEKNLSAIPENVSILKVNYDTESELKKKYGVTYQHTLVQVSADGSLIKKWSGGSNLGNLVSQIN
jgi:thiol-disulfide isomerase/thioredoxin